jgi:hypothetical protein
MGGAYPKLPLVFIRSAVEAIEDCLHRSTARRPHWNGGHWVHPDADQPARLMEVCGGVRATLDFQQVVAGLAPGGLGPLGAA